MIFLITALVICSITYTYSKHFYDEDDSFVGCIFSLFTGGLLITTLIVACAIPFCRHYDNVTIVKHDLLTKAFEKEKATSKFISPNSDFGKQILEWNLKIVSLQEENKSKWDWDFWTKDEIDNLKPIE